jgi:hypothetical protein
MHVPIPWTRTPDRAGWLVAIAAGIVAICACSSAPASHSALDLHTFDWKNIAAPGQACLTVRDVRLSNGSALIPDPKNGIPINPSGNGQRFDRLQEGPAEVTYGDLEDDQHPVAVVPLACSNNGGTADGVILYSLAVYSGRTGKLQLLGLITPRRQPANELATLLDHPQISPGAITVDEAWYGPRDGTCCPTGRATSSWNYSAGRLQPGHTEIDAYPSPS